MVKKKSDRVVPTKLSRPNTDRIAPRQRLFDKLDRETAEGAVWIQGPPGVGKTALTASWITHHAQRELWIQLDDSDSDIATFFHYLTRAIQICAPRAKLLKFSNEWRLTIQRFSRDYFRKVFSYKQLPQIWVLDDYHTLASKTDVHRVLNVAIAEKPSWLSIIILSRMEPPPQLSRLYAHEELRVIAPSELLLTAEEAKDVATFLGQQENPEFLESIRDKSEGWVLGFMRKLSEDPSDIALSTTDHLLFSYFSGEVFSRLDETSKTILVATSLVPDFNESFAISLTGVNSAGKRLLEFVRRGYFIYQLQRTPLSFRYHPLFRTYLMEQQEIVLGEQLIDYKRRISGLLWDEGRTELAMEFASEIGDWPLMEGYLVSACPRLFHQGRVAEIVEFVRRLPDNRLEQIPILRYWLGLSLFQTDTDSSLALLQPLYYVFDARGEKRERALVWSAIAEFFIFSLGDLFGLEKWIEHLDEIDEDFFDFDIDTQMVVVAAVIGILVHYRPQHHALEEWVSRAYTLAMSKQSSIQQRFKVARAIHFYYGFWGADMHRACQIMDTFGSVSSSSDPFSQLLWFLATSHYYFNAVELEQCSLSANNGLAIAGESGYHHWDGILSGILTIAEFQKGNVDTALARKEELSSIVATGPRIARFFFHYISGLVAMWQKNYGRARLESKIAIDLAKESGMPFARSSAYVLYAACNGEQKNIKEISRALEMCIENRHAMGEACARLNMAYQLLVAGEHNKSLEYLRRGLQMSREQGMINYVIIPSHYSRLCELAIEENIEVETARRNAIALHFPVNKIDQNVEPTQPILRIQVVDGDIFITGGPGGMTSKSKKAPKKLLELLKKLVNAIPRGCTRESLAFDLWEDADGDRAMQSLDTAVFRLRKYLGDPSFIISADGRIFLNMDKIIVESA